MSKFIATSVSAGLLAAMLMAAPVEAAPLGFIKAEAAANGVIKVWGGCGRGWRWSYRYSRCVRMWW